MPLGIKLLFTLAITVAAVLIYFSSSGENSTGPDWVWRLGKNDPVRNLLFRSDGSARRYMKTCALTLFALVLLIIWSLVPTINID